MDSHLAPRTSHLHFACVLAHEVLGVLLVFYPLLLLLDSVEPGFVRSVVNPHAFLLALIMVATLAPRDDRSLRPSVAKGEGGWSRRTIVVFGMCAAIVAGVWVWWSVGRGTLGTVVGALTAIATLTTIWNVSDDQDQSPSPGQ